MKLLSRFYRLIILSILTISLVYGLMIVYNNFNTWQNIKSAKNNKIPTKKHFLHKNKVVRIDKEITANYIFGKYVPPPPPPLPSEPSIEEKKQIRLNLIGVVLEESDPDKSIALITADGGEIKKYKTGDLLPNQAKLTKISAEKIELFLDDNNSDLKIEEVRGF